MRDPSSTSSSRAGMSASSSSSRSASSSMERPSLIMRWMRPPKVLGSSKLKPLVSSAVSKSSRTRSLTVLSLLSASARFLSSPMMALSGLISMVFFDAMYADMLLSRRAWAFMMRSMLALQPYLEVTRMHGESFSRRLTSMDSTLVPSTSFIHSVRPLSSSAAFSPSFFASSSSPRSSPSLVTSANSFSSKAPRLDSATSSTGSVRYSTSKPRSIRASTKGLEAAASRLSAAM
mmetsp:Transcript_33273/g.93319  ORF Transcript_33273/g.93319 Transcript_33273/m.93319 type:complete len:233 (-) Transcript_33273:1581-2279(-)